MKKYLIMCFMVAFLASCSNNNPWEYKVVKVAGMPAEELAEYGALVYGDQTAMLNKMGKEGWELVSTYTETATEFPNFGSQDYVTGIRDNTRTSVVNFVFKRQSNGKNENNAKPKKK